MSGVGAFPQTPVVPRRRGVPTKNTTPDHRASMGSTTSNSTPLPEAPRANTTPPATVAPGTGPVIPLTVLEAPTQRLYAAGFYALLLAWKLYDWVGVVDENTESFWLFLKWIAIDMVYWFGLPEMRIPWLELSQPAVVTIFAGHAILNFMMMFNVGFPWQSWLLGLVKVFYDRELAISEHNVKLSNILHNSSLIMGRQVINILPEGSAELNPDKFPFCLGGDRKVVSVPIQFNATIPVEVELIRTDLESNQQESIKLSRVQLRDIERKAKSHAHEGTETVVTFDYPIKKPGVYRLGKVLDEYKLEVQRGTPPTFVVPCPRAWVGSSSSPNRCVADLSDVTLQVEGTPPLKIVYDRTVNGKDKSIHLQSLQPDGFTSPLIGGLRSNKAVVTGLAWDDEDVSWARSQKVSVALNESMHSAGNWQYSVDEVHDAFGNVVKFTSAADDPEGKPKPKHLVHSFVVKERPQVLLEGCDLRNPLKVAKGDSKELPVRFRYPGPSPDDTSHSLTWIFSPIDTLTESGDHGDVVAAGSYHAKNTWDRPKISAPGLYTLKTVTARSCEGEVQEPASCLLLNPLEPKVTLRFEEIPDTCAGNSIGLKVDLDLVGTPPFVVRYDEISNGHRQPRKIQIPGLRWTMDLIPRVAGNHRYVLTHIDDAVYKGQKLSGPEYVLEQDVKPAAGAIIQHSTGKASACLGDEAKIDVLLLGDAPFHLEWEVIHDGKRKHHSASNIETNEFQIKTVPLTQGGEYTVALTSVHDKRGCKSSLQDEMKVSVRRQSPRAAFGMLDNKRKLLAIEGKTNKLPLRLTGEGPWRVFCKNLNEGSDSDKVLESKVHYDNGYLEVKGRGIFQITDVWDSQCHGIVDPKTSTFQVDWLARPTLDIALTHGVSQLESGQFTVAPVCEGDVSGFEVDLTGSSPFHVGYEVRHKALQGSGSITRKEYDCLLGKSSITAETGKAGTYTYVFNSLADNMYNNDKNFKSVIVTQQVNRKPSATFVKPGQTFKLCKAADSDAEGIPVTLTGVAPFFLEVEIRHETAAAPEIYRTPQINSNSYEIQIPRHHLRLGSHQIRIRDVKDASGCHTISDLNSASAVQIQLYEAPKIYPLETRTDYCVGERLSYTLSGIPPFEVWYTFDGNKLKAKSPTTNFRRIAESPGVFSINTISDKASDCRAPVDIVKTIHPMPAVKISKGRNVQVDIHEGSEVEILFEFWGTPPFEFTYTRSTNAKKGQKSQVLETRHDVSHEHSKVVRANQEGTYEVVAIKDRYCAFSTLQEQEKTKRIKY
ncbi:hypothetical protein OQA88_8836 [Cercophora sp. LCS_1]